jgi:hypothetical protein
MQLQINPVLSSIEIDDSSKTLMVNLARPLHQTHHAEIFEVPLRSVHQDYEMNEHREIGLLFLV